MHTFEAVAARAGGDGYMYGRSTISTCSVFNKKKFCVCARARGTHVPSFEGRLRHTAEICDTTATLGVAVLL